MRGGEGHDRVALLALGLYLLPLLVAVIWSSLSLHVRRIRDIGWDPAVVVVSWIIFNIADKLILVRLLPAPPANHGVQSGTFLGLAINFALSLALLFWPGRREDDAASVPPGRFASGRAASSGPVVSRTPRPGAPVQFGRR